MVIADESRLTVIEFAVTDVRRILRAKDLNKENVIFARVNCLVISRLSSPHFAGAPSHWTRDTSPLCSLLQFEV
jgi:hypothetical protein